MAAFDLAARQLLWRRRVETKGLLNVVSAPQLSPLSTSVALPTWDVPLSTEHSTPALVFESWDGTSSATPRTISLSTKRLVARLPPHQLPSDALGPGAFVALRHVDVSALAEEVSKRAAEGLWDPAQAAEHNAVLVGREDNMAKFKPGVQTVHLIFSDQAAKQCYHFPYWAQWRPLVMPILDTVLSWYGVPPQERENRVVRLQLARMGPGGAIKRHADKGGWAEGLHRVHIPLISNPEARGGMPRTIRSRDEAQN